MKISQLASAKVLVGKDGGEIRFADGNGDLIPLGVPAGVHLGRELFDGLPADWDVDPGSGVTILAPAGERASRMRMGAVAYQSGANPDYRPSSADADRRRLEMLVQQSNRRSQRLEQRLESLARLSERVPSEPLELIDDGDQPSVETAETAVQPPVESAPISTTNGAADASTI
ncbi:hypothetical protein [Nioella nitratireducens]|uniref:hypothetical protein n=1 Tax=Nioella nitratireducens TaxID=1287720 RepID=UPI0008FD30A4|nr:hypothetical protein [Nioella nitratireducens]